MDLFVDKYASHDHALRMLELISAYDGFMDSLTVVADMGAGSGMDINWWATLETRDDPPVPFNYVCYAIDKDVSKLKKEELPTNVTVIEGNFEERVIPRPVDVLWSHDSFQYALNPLLTLKTWNEQMSVNGMLAMILPQTSNYQYNRIVNRVHDGCFYSYNACNLIYMLAVNGFDCKEFYLYKAPNDPWIHVATYKTENKPMDPATTRWYDLVDKGLLHDSLAASINKYGYLRQEDIILPWLDRDFYFVQD